MNVAQWFDYAPYGSVMATTNTGSDQSCQTIHRPVYGDSGLSYLNARYYNPAQGQFITQDPVFLGDPRAQNLADPQSLNSYSYAEDNPINRKDADGRAASLTSILSSLISVLRSLLSIPGGGGGGGVSGGPSVQTGGNTNTTQSATKNVNTYTSVSLPGGHEQQKTSTGCFNACAGMVGYTPNSRSRIVTSDFNNNGRLTPQSSAREGIQTIDSYLANGRPISVGLNINGGTQSDNGIKATQHFVVIDGSGTDAGGKYYHFVDPYPGHGMNSGK